MKKLISSLISTVMLTALITSCSSSEDLVLDPQLENGQFESFARKNSTSKNDSETITVATYNIRNLFDGIKNEVNGVKQSVADAPEASEQAKPEKELKALADSLREINPDVIAMQEVESKSTLSGFLNKYVPELGYKVVLIEGNDERGIDVALITKLDIVEIKSHKDEKFPVINQPGKTQVFQRDLLQVSLKTSNNYNFTAFVGHLKSKHGGAASDLIRQAEATKINEIVTAFKNENPNANFVLMGDFNDTVNSNPLKPILNSNLSLSDIIKEDLGTGKDVYTYHPIKFRERIDYMLVSPSMKNEYIKGSVKISKFPQDMSNEDKKWMFYQASDHLPVTAKFSTSNDK
ncbi:MAG: endonuclease/exonuclease/phosphatase family protein [Candidatus Sericytochromatia bacterium]